MILSKSQLVNNIITDISDQAYSQISPYDIRHNLLDIIDSAHNLLIDKELKSINLATSPSGNTKLGESSFNNFSSTNNTAIGFETLKNNIDGSNNTAIGANALSCNAYGVDNIAVGYNALGGNTVGSLNIGIGNYTLNRNKSGNGNIVIGHGAGYYVDKNTSNKLFIASHPINSNYICSNPDGSGLIPLIHGDLSSLKLGIGTRSLHQYGTLQVGGDIAPSANAIYNIGHSLYSWKNIYLSDSVIFSNDTYFATQFNYINCKGSIVPIESNIYNFGQSSKKWSTGYFQNLVVDGVANINQIVSLTTSSYNNKILYLAASNTLTPIFSDSELDGGGIILKSTTNAKNYEISFRPPDQGMPCFNDDFNAVWYTNINFQVPSNRYIKTNSIVSYNPSAFGDSDCFGLFFNSGITYISRKNILNSDPGSSSGHLAGIGNFNLLSNSGQLNDYIFSICGIESGVNVSQRFLSGTKSRIKDIYNNYKDKLKGFELKYIDDSLAGIQGLTDRFVVGSYNNTSKFVNGFILMKDSNDGGVFGITNMTSVVEQALPKTIFNIRSINDCVARLTCENNNFNKSAIQLLGYENCETSGVEFNYLNISGVSDISIFKNGYKNIFLRMKDTNQIGILSSGIISNSTITIGHSGISKLPTIALKDNTFVNDSTIIPDSGYGKIYNLRTFKDYANQYNSLFYMDASGNDFNLIVNKYDNLDGRAVFVDNSGNTFAGYQSPSNRLSINSAFANNTAYGYRSLYDLTSGSGNIAIGSNSLNNLISGNNNIVVGKNSATEIEISNNNIVIGNDSFNRSLDFSATSGNIIIGHDGVGNLATGSYNFIIGSQSGVILLNGKLGPNNSDKKLTLPSGGRLYINNANDSESLHVENNLIEIIDYGGSNYPDNDFKFRFTGNNSADLLVLNHNSNILTNPTSYAGSNRPFASLNGDFRLQGFIRFSDGTSLNTSSGIDNATNLANSGVALGNSGINAFIEGVMPFGLSAPAVNQKSSGIMIIKNQQWSNTSTIYIINRDFTSVIHSGAYVIAARINNEYKPIWVSSEDTNCCCPA